MDRMAVYPVRIPHDIKAALPEVAKKYGMTAPELVRAIIGLIVTGQIELTLVQNDQGNCGSYVKQNGIEKFDKREKRRDSCWFGKR